MANEALKSDVTSTLERLKAKGEVAAYYWTDRGGKPTVELTIIGRRSKEVTELLERRSDLVNQNPRQEEEGYYFLGGELRPGTGIIRRAGGRPGGPGGTLTCFLSSRDSQDLYFAAAGHVLTNFWTTSSSDPDGSIYLSRRGYPGTNSTRFLGNLVHCPPRPRRRDREDPDPRQIRSDLDIAFVKLEGNFDVRQRTTCYGHFGEWPSAPQDIVVRRDQPLTVMKCGAEETHWTAAVVKEINKTVLIYGRDVVYELENQVILESPEIESSGKENISPARSVQQARQSIPVQRSSEEQPPVRPCQPVPRLANNLPGNSPETPFAVAGDSGTMVVDQETKRPVGMLIAGSILDRKYVMTPISTLAKYWNEQNFVLLRA